jgi:exosortase E/protease (VPEID-CTERM system)
MPSLLALAPPDRPAAPRLVAALVVLAAEVALALAALDFDHLRGAPVWWAEPMRLLSHNAPWAACVGAVVALLGFGRFGAAGRALAARVPTPFESLTALALHAALALFFAAVSQLVLAGGTTVAWLQATLPFVWFAAGFGLVASLGLAAAPPSCWRAALAPIARPVVAGVLVGSALFWAGRAVDGNYVLWGPLADVTLATSAALLRLVTEDVHLEESTRILGVGSFRVIVSKYCSGLEGLALFGLFFGAFLVLVRSRLRLARAAWLLPAGMLCVWFLNAVRIAALVALGAFHDPRLAVDAFHTHAGWPPLVAVALGCVALTTRVPFFARAGALERAQDTATATRGARAPDGTAAHLVPLLGVVATGLVAGAFLEHGGSSAPLRALVGAALLWSVRRSLGVQDLGRALRAFAGAFAQVHVWLFGAAALAVWLAFDAERGLGGTLPGWLAGAHPAAALAFWVLAFASYALVTPCVEELAFRGYLQRRLVHAEFEAVPFSRLTPLALGGSALAFGALHTNLLGGVAVALLFALAAARRGRLVDAVAVHALVNAALAVLAVATGRYGLWF